MWLPLPGKSWGSEPPMKLVIGSDHAGFALKVAMGDLLRSLGHEVLDVGAFNENPSEDRKSTRLNSSHGYISYAAFCLKKKKQKHRPPHNNTHRALCSY